MSYSTDPAETFRQVGAYTGRIIKGAKPADLAVSQSTKFDFAINLIAARALGIEAPFGSRRSRRGDRVNRQSFIALPVMLRR